MLVAAYPKHGRPLPTFGNLLSLPNFLQPPPALELDDYDLQQFALLAPDEEDEQVPQNDDTTATPEGSSSNVFLFQTDTVSRILIFEDISHSFTSNDVKATSVIRDAKQYLIGMNN